MSFAIPFSPTVPTETLVKGNWYPQLRLQRAKFDPNRGFVYDYEWIGANQTLMQPVFQDCIDAGMSCTCTFENDRAQLSVSDSTSEYTIDSWEIRANEEIRDLFSHPFIVNSIYTVVGSQSNSTDVLSAIRTHIADNDKIATLAADPMLAGLTGFNVWYLILDFYNLYMQGTTGYRRAQYVLRHKTNVSNRWGVNIADFGIDQVYTPSQLLIEVSDPDLWVFPLPGRLQYKLAAIPAQISPVPASVIPPPYMTYNYVWGWLKAASTEITDANNRVAIETDYTLELWDTEIYAPYGTTPPWQTSPL